MWRGTRVHWCQLCHHHENPRPGAVMLQSPGTPLQGGHTWQLCGNGAEVALGGSRLATTAATSVLPKVMARLGGPCTAGNTGAGCWHPPEPGWGVWGWVEDAPCGEWWDLDLCSCWQRVQGISLVVPDPSH